MNNRYSDFIQANRELWSKVPTSKGSNGLLLVEPQRHPIISHANAVFARIIKEAKGLNIGWIDTGDLEIQERLISYDSTSTTIPLSGLTRFDKLVVGSRFACSALKMLLTGDILSFALDDIPFGDILYDSYLARFKVATVPRVNKGLLSTLFTLINHYYCLKRTLQDYGATAVLTSHQVGLTSGVLLRTALGSGIEAYLRTGGGIANWVTFDRFTSLTEIYNYQLKLRECDIEHLLSIEQKIIEDQFNDLMNIRMSGGTDRDANLAFHTSKTLYASRQKFAKGFDIDPGKKNVFVMLNAFNDHPHSHYGWMIFKDYYDWFVQTLEFARIKSDVNWVFKEHPASRYYPTRDLSLPEHFKSCPDHVVLLDAESSFSSKSLLYLADVIITGRGSPGVEFASAGGIPAILAGRTFYSGFGFTVEPRSREEYFQVLAGVQQIEKLTKEQQYMAKIVFLYHQEYGRSPFDWSPVIPYDEIRNPDLDTYYWGLVVKQYHEKPDTLMQQFNEYMNPIGRPGFSRLSFPFPLNSAEQEDDRDGKSHTH